MLAKLGVAIGFCLIALPLSAQVDQSFINGTITDSRNAVVPNAKIEANSAEPGLRRQVSSGDTGTYQLTGLPIGVYKITVEKEGFKSTTVDQLTLSVGEGRTVDVRLEVGASSEIIDVHSTAESINRDSAEVGAAIDSDQIRNLPING